MRQLLTKLVATARIELSTILAYKINFLLQILGPAVVFFLVKANLWSAIYIARDGAPVAGYDFQRMMGYQGYVLVVAILAQSFANRNISEDIRMGRISSFLLYPFGFISFYVGVFLATQLVNILTAVCVVSLLLISGFVVLTSPLQLVVAVTFTMGVALFWFVLWFLLSILAFWLEETWVLRVMMLLTVKFLSGSVIPLELFPSVWREVLFYTPFPYLTFVPVQLFMGSYQGSVWVAFTVLAVWTAITTLLVSQVWNRGIRLYSAAGI